MPAPESDPASVPSNGISNGPASALGCAPGHARSPLFLLGLVAATQLLGWATTFSLPAVLGPAIAAELGMSLPAVFAASAAFLLSLALVSPLLSRPFERFGARPLLTLGSGMIGAGLGWLSLCQGPISYFAAWSLVGAGGAMGLSTGANVLLAERLGPKAKRGIGGVMLITGLAGSIGLPAMLAAQDAFGWRGTLALFAAVNLVLVMPANWFGPGPRPTPEAAPEAPPPATPPATPHASQTPEPERDAGSEPSPVPLPIPPNVAPNPAAAPVMQARQAPFRLSLSRLRAAAGPAPLPPLPEEEPARFLRLAVALSLVGAVGWGLSIAMPEILTGFGMERAAAVGLVSLIGVAQVGARMVDFALGAPFRALTLALVATLVTPLGLLALWLGWGVAGGLWWTAALYALLYGAASGVLAVCRATLPLELFDPAAYARHATRLALPMNLTFAAGPPLFGWLLGRFGPGAPVATAMAATLVACLVLVSLRRLVARQEAARGAA